MDPAILQKIERLAAANIQILPLPQLPNHFVLERGGCAVLVERAATGFGQIGAPGLLTAEGFAVLVERQGAPFFVYKGGELPATPEQAATARQLFTDLRLALE